MKIDMIKEIVNIKQNILTLDWEGFICEELDYLLDHLKVQLNSLFCLFDSCPKPTSTLN